MKIPGRVSDVFRSLAGSGVAAAVAFFCGRASRPIYGGCRLRPTRQFTQHNGLNLTVSAWPPSQTETADGFSRVWVSQARARV